MKKKKKRKTLVIISEANLVEKMMKSNGTLKNPMKESSGRLFSFIPESFEEVMALVVLPPVEKLHCFLEATVLILVVVVDVFGSRKPVGNRKGFQRYLLQVSFLVCRCKGGNHGWIVSVQKMAGERGEGKREFESSHGYWLDFSPFFFFFLRGKKYLISLATVLFSVMLLLFVW